MPGVGLVLHSIGSEDIWQLGQRGPGYHLQTGIPPGHIIHQPSPKSSVVAKIYSGSAPQHLYVSGTHAQPSSEHFASLEACFLCSEIWADDAE